MVSVGVRELKSHLSEYLRMVRRGEEILVTDRGEEPGQVFCPPGGRDEVIAGLTISLSLWQCAGHGDAAGPGLVD